MSQVDRQFIEEFTNRIQSYFGRTPWPPDMDEEEVDEIIERYQETLDWAQDHGLYDIGEGRDRITFESRSSSVIPNDCVLKISKGDGTSQNREAIEIWESMDEEARKCVAPFVDWEEYGWIVQKQASHTARGTEDVIDNLEEAGWVCSDIRSENIGIYEGRFVLLDLGVGLREI